MVDNGWIMTEQNIGGNFHWGTDGYKEVPWVYGGFGDSAYFVLVDLGYISIPFFKNLAILF